jgi:hypothetical protein
VRNAAGSFALFGGNSLAKEQLLHLDDPKHASFMQNFVSSTVGAVMSLLVSSPMDVVKTRIQADHFGKRNSAIRVAGEMLTKEGIRSFYKVRARGPRAGHRVFRASPSPPSLIWHARARRASRPSSSRSARSLSSPSPWRRAWCVRPAAPTAAAR